MVPDRGYRLMLPVLPFDHPELVRSDPDVATLDAGRSTRLPEALRRTLLASPSRVTGEELADALRARGVDSSGWELVTVKPEGKERWPTQGWRLGGWTLAPGGKKGYANFSRAMEKGESWLTSADGLLSYFVGDVDELAEIFLDLVEVQ